MKSHQILSLNGIRFLLAMWVVIGHFYTFIGGDQYYKFGRPIESVIRSPMIAVYGFMVITGFLMMHNLIIREGKEPIKSRSTFIKFWLRRFFRLYPLYILLLSIAFIFFTNTAKMLENTLIYFTGSNVTQWGFVRSIKPPTFTDYLTHVFMIHGLFPQYHDSILGVTWSLSLEMQFYFICPFLYLLIFRTREHMRKWLIPLLSLATYIALKLPGFINHHTHEPHFREPSFLLYTFPLFLLGMIIAGVRQQRISITYFIVSLLLVIYNADLNTTLLIATLLTFMFFDKLHSVLPSVLAIPLNAVNSFLSGKLARFGSDISYSLYLIHTMVMAVVLQIMTTYAGELHLNKAQTISLAFIAVLIICFLICYILFKWVEQPFIDIGRRVLSQSKKQVSHPVE